MLNLERSLVRSRRGFRVAGSEPRRTRVARAALHSVELGVLALSLLALADAGCAAPQKSPAEKPPSYFRSPTLDYQDPPRSASDGEVMGANKQSPDETLQASPTNEHLAPGWEIENGTLVASPEARQRGHGSHAHEPGCEPAENVKSPEAATSTDNEAAEAKDPVRKALRPVCKEGQKPGNAR
jgi:hypothetical protein